MFALSQFILAV